MAVFRVEKTKNYTVMSNHHLRDKALSLKAKGLLSQMLSLPDGWDYSERGLAHINDVGLGAIKSAVKELERAGYIARSRIRNERGCLKGAEYVVYEVPQDKAKAEKPENTPSAPMSGFPTLDNPILEQPTLANPPQSNKEQSNTDSPSDSPHPFPSPRPCEGNAERNGTDISGMTAFDVYREIILDNLEYPIMAERYPYDRERIDEIVELMLETVCTSRKTLRIAGDDYPAGLVKSKFMKLTSRHLEYVLECLKENTTEIRNIKKYLLAVLFNAPSTIDSYVAALVARKTGQGDCF